MTVRYKLNVAIKARRASWDACRALEKELGLDDPTDLQDTIIQEWIAGFAVGNGDASQADVEELQRKIKEVTKP